MSNYSSKREYRTDFNPIALRKAKIVHNFGLSECSRIEVKEYTPKFSSIFTKCDKFAFLDKAIKNGIYS